MNAIESYLRECVTFYADGARALHARVRKALDPVERYDTARTRYEATGKGLDAVTRAVTPRVARVISQREAAAAEAARKALEAAATSERIRRMVAMAERMRRRDLAIARVFRAIACVGIGVLVSLTVVGLVDLWQHTGPHRLQRAAVMQPAPGRDGCEILLRPGHVLISDPADNRQLGVPVTAGEVFCQFSRPSPVIEVGGLLTYDGPGVTWEYVPEATP